MNIVFFVESYFHKPLMNGICVKKVADKLIEEGHDVTVFTSSENVYDIPSSEIVGGVKVFRIRRDFYTFLRLYLENHKDKSHKFLSLFKKYYGMFLSVIYSRHWPLKSFLTPFRYYSVAKKHLKNTTVDVIVGTYFHIEEVLAAMKLKKKYKNATLITYTLDAMSGRMTPKIFGKEGYAKKSILRWEEYVFKKSDKICVMESHRSHYTNGSYEAEILNKIKYVDIPLLDVSKNNSANIHTAENSKKIVYAGTCTRETGSAKYLVELLKEIKTAELHLYGKVDDELKTAISKSSLENKRIFFHGFVDHCVVENALENADFLATFGSCNECMISGKIFEYMSKKKPIIAFYQIDNDSNLSYLKKYPDVMIIKEYYNEYEADVKALSKFINRDSFTSVDNDYLKNIFYKNTPEAMVKEILN